MVLLNHHHCVLPPCFALFGVEAFDEVAFAVFALFSGEEFAECFVQTKPLSRQSKRVSSFYDCVSDSWFWPWEWLFHCQLHDPPH